MESYSLAWYFAARNTIHDHYEKRGLKGFIFTIGDEPIHNSISGLKMGEILHGGEHINYETSRLLNEAQKMYHVYHIHVKDTSYWGSKSASNQWREILGDKLIEVENHEDIPLTIARHVNQQAVKDLREILTD